MNEEQNHLWQKISRFELDDPKADFSLTDRICKEYNWPMTFALKAIEEYKKFIFLICSSNQSQTPSEVVDKVWHLHLIYTKSYWIDFCQNTLNRLVHHNPQTGAEENDLFVDQYQNTLSLYKTMFQQEPPKDIWQETLYQNAANHSNPIQKLMTKIFKK